MLARPLSNPHGSGVTGDFPDCCGPLSLVNCHKNLIKLTNPVEEFLSLVPPFIPHEILQTRVECFRWFQRSG